MGAGSRLSPRSAHPGLSRALSLAPPAVVAKLSPPKVQPFEAIPRNGHNAWLNLFQFWRTNAFQNLHRVMDRNFQHLGPIYRAVSASGWSFQLLLSLGKTAQLAGRSVNVFLPQDAAQLFQTEGIFPRRMGIDSWLAHRALRNHKCGVFLLWELQATLPARPGLTCVCMGVCVCVTLFCRNGEEWRSDRLILNKEVISPAGTRKFLPFLNTVAEDFVAFMYRQIRKNTRGSLTVDLYHDLFRFTLEASSYALYGERLGLLEESPKPESQEFISAVETMLQTTLPLLFLPPGVMRWVNNRLWQQHLKAWDTIFSHADKCIQNIYQEFCLGKPRKYSGIMAELLVQAELPLDSIKANVTELTAGGVDTTAMPLLFTLFELARNPQVQTAIREEIRGAQAQGSRELAKLLNAMPLLKGALKETLRLPPGAAWQEGRRLPPSGAPPFLPPQTLCQVGLYSMGRSPAVFTEPEQYRPSRWLGKEDHSFKALAFGFGSRQCIGRRLAEAEMALFLMHILKNFKIDTVFKEDIRTIYSFILKPEKPPRLTFRPID
uniref:steroid 11beta-monooxygenase n=1 Tax=Laticauda laticaudata TaxID=8630 RepID=A0A8C5RF07_LATLA